jgi:hypothetical protein
MAENEFMKTSPRIIGFIQAAGLTLYVSLFATIIRQAQNWLLFQGIRSSPTASIILFLLAFVISALVCGSLILGRPLLLFFSGKHREAMQIILWSLLWLVAMAICVGLISFFLLN